MKKDNAKMLIHLDLGENFLDILKEVMADEFEISCRKWNVRPNTEDKNYIFTHSIRQVRRKVSTNARTNWDLSDHLTIKVNSYQREANEVSLPDDTLELQNNLPTLINTRDGWEIDYEESLEAVALKDFHQFMKDKIKFWTRTAVFYGVGSFTQ